MTYNTCIPEMLTLQKSNLVTVEYERMVVCIHCKYPCDHVTGHVPASKINAELFSLLMMLKLLE